MYGTKMSATFTSPKTGEDMRIALCPPVDLESGAKCFTEWFNDNKVRQYLSRNVGLTENVEVDWLKNQNDKKEDLVWMVYVNDELIGSLGLHRINFVDQLAELGICIGDKKYWGKGIATVIEIMVIEYAFNNIVAGGLHKVWARVYTDNIASRKALETKVGFRTIGIKKEEVWCNGGWYDTWLGEILASDWKKKRAQAIKKAGITSIDLYPGCEKS